jgi:hypothetical protein
MCAGSVICDVSSMRTTHTLKAILGSSLLCTCLAVAGESEWPRLTRFDACKDSKLTIQGGDLAGQWTAQTSVIGGSIALDKNFLSSSGQRAAQAKVEAHAEVFIPVRSLKSIDQKWEPYNDQINAVDGVRP